jgi:hypothetical protein
MIIFHDIFQFFLGVLLIYSKNKDSAIKKIQRKRLICKHRIKSRLLKAKDTLKILVLRLKFSDLKLDDVM